MSLRGLTTCDISQIMAGVSSIFSVGVLENGYYTVEHAIIMNMNELNVTTHLHGDMKPYSVNE